MQPIILIAKVNRSLRLDDDEKIPLWDDMKSCTSLEKCGVDALKRNGDPGNEAVVDTYTSEVTLSSKGKNGVHLRYMRFM